MNQIESLPLDGDRVEQKPGQKLFVSMLMNKSNIFWWYMI